MICNIVFRIVTLNFRLGHNFLVACNAPKSQAEYEIASGRAIKFFVNLRGICWPVTQVFHEQTLTRARAWSCPTENARKSACASCR